MHTRELFLCLYNPVNMIFDISSKRLVSKLLIHDKYEEVPRRPKFIQGPTK